MSDPMLRFNASGRPRDEAVSFGVFAKVAVAYAFDAAKRRATELLFSVENSGRPAYYQRDAGRVGARTGTPKPSTELPVGDLHAVYSADLRHRRSPCQTEHPDNVTTACARYAAARGRNGRSVRTVGA
jgi:hypothetical protein